MKWHTAILSACAVTRNGTGVTVHAPVDETPVIDRLASRPAPLDPLRLDTETSSGEEGGEEGGIGDGRGGEEGSGDGRGADGEVGRESGGEECAGNPGGACSEYKVYSIRSVRVIREELLPYKT